jgi:hypothetical protein
VSIIVRAALHRCFGCVGGMYVCMCVYVCVCVCVVMQYMVYNCVYYCMCIYIVSIIVCCMCIYIVSIIVCCMCIYIVSIIVCCMCIYLRDTSPLRAALHRRFGCTGGMYHNNRRRMCGMCGYEVQLCLLLSYILLFTDALGVLEVVHMNAAVSTLEYKNPPFLLSFNIIFLLLYCLLIFFSYYTHIGGAYECRRVYVRVPLEGAAGRCHVSY